MNKEEITDPFVLKIMELDGFKQEELSSPMDYGKVANNVCFAEYAYLIGEIQYLLLKHSLEKKDNKNMTEEEIRNYCEEEKSKKSYFLKKETRYLLPSPLKIQIDRDADILPTIEKIMIEIREKYINDRFFRPVSETQIKQCMNLQSYANYYDCIEGTQNYFKLRDMGIDKYMESKKERTEGEKTLPHKGK